MCVIAIGECVIDDSCVISALRVYVQSVQWVMGTVVSNCNSLCGERVTSGGEWTEAHRPDLWPLDVQIDIQSWIDIKLQSIIELDRYSDI